MVPKSQFRDLFSEGPEHLSEGPEHLSGPQAPFRAPSTFQGPEHLSGPRAPFRAPSTFQGPEHLSGPRAPFRAPSTFQGPKHLSEGPKHLSEGPKHLSGAGCTTRLESRICKYYKLAKFKTSNCSGQRGLTSALPVRRTVSRV